MCCFILLITLCQNSGSLDDFFGVCQRQAAEDGHVHTILLLFYNFFQFQTYISSILIVLSHIVYNTFEVFLCTFACSVHGEIAEKFFVVLVFG